MAALDGENIGILSELILHSWPLNNAEVQKELQAYWFFRDEIALLDGIAMKGRRITVPAAL